MKETQTRDETVEFFNAARLTEIAEDNGYDPADFLLFAIEEGVLEAEFESDEDFEVAVLDLCSAHRSSR